MVVVVVVVVIVVVVVVVVVLVNLSAWHMYMSRAFTAETSTMKSVFFIDEHNHERPYVTNLQCRTQKNQRARRYKFRKEHI